MPRGMRGQEEGSRGGNLATVVSPPGARDESVRSTARCIRPSPSVSIQAESCGDGEALQLIPT